VFLPAENSYTHLSSTLIKEVAALGGDIADFVPKAVLQRFQQDEQGQ
jgi:pantetheine-phosphate adenylyltransferase